MGKSGKPKGVELPKPVLTDEHEDKRHAAMDYTYPRPEKEARDGKAR